MHENSTTEKVDNYKTDFRVFSAVGAENPKIGFDLKIANENCGCL
jgi:hypothetical protein